MAHFSNNLSCMEAWAFSADNPLHLCLPLPLPSLVSAIFSGDWGASDPDMAKSSMILKMSAVGVSGIVGEQCVGRQSCLLSQGPINNYWKKTMQ